MWSLPNLSALNKRAVSEHKRRRGRAPSLRGKKCDYCDEKAEVAEPYYDIFGDKDVPKGHVLMCSQHADTGVLQEGYFWCEGCNRYHVRNYTWELYARQTEDGELCLRCAFEEALDSDDPEKNPWVTRADVEQLKGWMARGLEDRAFRWIAQKAKHLIAVESTYWEERLIFQANVELDSSTGERIRGFSSKDSGVAAGVREIIEHLDKVLANTQMRDFLRSPAEFVLDGSGQNARCALILDGGYQFAVSIGIYFERVYTRKKEAG
jgi:hypothetical protein